MTYLPEEQPVDHPAQAAPGLPLLFHTPGVARQGFIGKAADQRIQKLIYGYQELRYHTGHSITGSKAMTSATLPGIGLVPACTSASRV